MGSVVGSAGLIGGFCLLWLAMLLIIPFLGMVAWNFVAPQFGLPQIDFLTAVATYFLLAIVGGLFRGGRK